MATSDPVPGPPPQASLLAQLPPSVRHVGTLVGLAAAVAAGVYLALWTNEPNMTPLYAGLAERDVAEVVALLDGADVPYRLDPATGAVMVPSSRRYELRMQMASAGLPRGSGFGIDEMPERSSFGSSPFMENALYAHAVETELARTITAMQPVESARVHLAISRQSVFVSQQRESSASVFLRLFPGRVLEDSQVQAVVHLVASAVPELATDRVTVADQAGRLLTRPRGDSTAQMTSTQFDYAKQLENDYANRIEQMLEAIVGPGRVRATVAAELDFTVSEETSETFNPANTVVRSETTTEEPRESGALAQGIPGALANQPPGAAPVAAAGVNAAAPAAPAGIARTATRNFEVDKTISHTTQALGIIQRLSIGVLIDNKPPANGTGPGEPIVQEELDSLTQLVQQSVGFDAARGDTISMVNQQFQQAPVIQAPEPPPIWQRPVVWDIVRQVLGAGLVLVLAFVVVRPIMTSLTRPQPAIPLLDSQQLGGQPGYALTGSVPALPAGYDDRITAARSVAGQDPRQIAQVMRNWVAEDNG